MHPHATIGQSVDGRTNVDRVPPETIKLGDNEHITRL
jgi:hypothetical protein